MTRLLVLAGIAQLALVVVSPAIPVVLRWREQTAPLPPLTRSVFWTYAGYILGAHLAFGLLSAFAPHLLLDGTPLARAVAGFIAAWWGARLVIQFASFGAHRPRGAFFLLAEIALVTLFIANTAIYGAIAGGWR